MICKMSRRMGFGMSAFVMWLWALGEKRVAGLGTEMAQIVDCAVISMNDLRFYEEHVPSRE